MVHDSSDSISSCCAASPLQLERNLHTFKQVLRKAEIAYRLRYYAASAALCEVAALFAVARHPGIFSSIQLEKILHNISAKIPPSDVNVAHLRANCSGRQSVLHVATQVRDTGGLSRMLYLWMTRDKERQHSLALTRQQNRPVPGPIDAAVKQSGGHIVALDQHSKNLIDRAIQLRNLAANFELVVLHVWNEDVVPSIAFSSCTDKPRVLFLDHADHMFWVGLFASDFFISMRDSGMQLARERRGVDASRSLMLPIALEESQRSHARAAAKQILGYPKDSIIILSVARAVKFRTINGVSFADAHVDVLKRHSNAYLVVVGAGDRKDWVPAISSVNGRIHSYAETPDTKLFFEAADIYVDSFPFVSITSMLEAGLYGLPLVTRFPYDASMNQILGADAPGLRDHVIRAATIDEYIFHVSRLVDNPTLRSDLGAAIRLGITNAHTGDLWMRNLEAIYSTAIDTPRSNHPLPTAGTDQFKADAPDIFLESAFGRAVSLDDLLRQYNYGRYLPIDERLALACIQLSARAARKVRKIMHSGSQQE